LFAHQSALRDVHRLLDNRQGVILASPAFSHLAEGFREIGALRKPPADKALRKFYLALTHHPQAVLQRSGEGKVSEPEVLKAAHALASGFARSGHAEAMRLVIDASAVPATYQFRRPSRMRFFDGLLLVGSPGYL